MAVSSCSKGAAVNKSRHSRKAIFSAAPPSLRSLAQTFATFALKRVATDFLPFTLNVEDAEVLAKVRRGTDGSIREWSRNLE